MDCYHGDKGRLTAPRRNSFFYGKMMGVLQFGMEQTYGAAHRRLMNRLSLGTGVLCGLDVQKNQADPNQLCVMPGVAIDALGQEIVVAGGYCFDPWHLTDDCGRPGETLAKNAKHLVRVCIQYDECATDFMPLAATECNTREQCAPGTIVESFRVLVQKVANGTPDPLPEAVDDELCKALAFGPEGKGATTGERLRLLSARLALPGACLTPPTDTCITLATVELLPSGTDGTIGEVDTLTYRPTVYSNAVLLELILCLMERVEECCAKQVVPTTPPPTTAPPPTTTPPPTTVPPTTIPPPTTVPPTTTPPPTTVPPPTTKPPQTLLVVEKVEFLAKSKLLYTLQNRQEVPKLKLSQEPTTIRVTFNQNLDATTVTTTTQASPDPGMASFLVIGGGSGFSGPVLGLIDIIPSRLRVANFIIKQTGTFKIGRYAVRLFGDQDPAQLRPAISAAGGTRLDGDENGAEGGNYEFTFAVTN